MPAPLTCRALLCSLLLTLPALADETAKEISDKSQERGSLNLVNLTAELRLTTTSKAGAAKIQVLTTSSKKIAGRAHSIARFSQPPGVAGTAVLTLEGQGGGASEISLYLPKLKRVRKVAASSRGQSFQETDFSYADLGGTGAASDDSLKRLADEPVDGRPAYVLSGTAGPDSPYSDVKVWVDRQTYVPLKAEYADKAGKPFKRYKAGKLKKFKDRTIAAEATMENLQTGSRTQVEILRLEDTQLSDDAFSERALERG